jgi:hypothetical protein
VRVRVVRVQAVRSLNTEQMLQARCSPSPKRKRQERARAGTGTACILQVASKWCTRTPCQLPAAAVLRVVKEKEKKAGQVEVIVVTD